MTTPTYDKTVTDSTTNLLRVNGHTEDPTVHALAYALADNQYRERMPSEKTILLTAQKIVDTAYELKKMGLVVQREVYKPTDYYQFVRLYLRRPEDVAKDVADDMLTLKEAAEMLGTSTQRILHHYINQPRYGFSGQITGEKTDKGWRVSKKSVEAYLNRNDPPADPYRDELADRCIAFVQHQIVDGNRYTELSHLGCRQLCDLLLAYGREYSAAPHELVLSQAQFLYRQLESECWRWEGRIYDRVRAEFPDDADHEALYLAVNAAKEEDPDFPQYNQKQSAMASLQERIDAAKAGD